ncbi:hypothetical protein GE061_003788 [Apolygus lucorum]|uniref:Major facilitator superfamily (MFS) profile domain-containing protein n=1 Tax=Apolygus lucorum TaxID=248454 RepID=A0A6A4JFD3_APOLU|nr:hypothetical protein GE061_003788 [Apolygus lucorum]
MVFIRISRILGVYPFEKNGKFDVLSYTTFLVQLIGIFAFDYLPITAQQFQELTRDNMLVTLVQVNTRTIYFVAPFIHAVHILRFKSKFASVTMFLEDGKDSWTSKYVSYVGLVAVVLATYFIVVISVILIRVAGGGQLGNPIMQHMFFLDFLILTQYSILANKISIEYAKSSDLLKRHLVVRALAKRNRIVDNLKDMNTIYGPQLLIRVMQGFITLLGFAFGAATSRLHSMSVSERVGQVMVFTMILGELFCACGVCTSAKDQADSFNLKLFKLMQNNRGLCGNKQLQLYLAMKQSIDFTAAGFFSLGYPLLLSVIAAATTRRNDIFGSTGQQCVLNQTVSTMPPESTPLIPPDVDYGSSSISRSQTTQYYLFFAFNVANKHSRYSYNMGKEKEEEKPPVSNLRRMIPQILAVTAKNTLLLNFGLSLAFPTIVIPALQKPNPDIIMTKEQISWFGSLYFVIIPFGCLASGPLTHKFGRRTMMLMLCVPFAAAWLVFYWASTPAMLFAALILHGSINGLMESPVLTYVGEVCEPDIRGPLASTTTLAALIGVSLQLLLANFLDWKNLSLLNVGAPLLSFIALLAIPESPHWLAGKDRFKEVERSLMWLRGWVPSSHVKKEVEDLQTSNNTASVESPFQCKLYKDPTFYKPFLLVSFTFFVGHFGGMSTLQTYAVGIYESIKSPIPPLQATAIGGFIQFAGSFFCVLVLPFIGRRVLAILCTLLTAVLLVVLVAVDEGWAAMLCLLGSVFLINTCSKVIPWVLIGEVFTPDVRSIASGMVTCLGYFLGFVVNFSWLWCLDVFGLRAMFVSYAVVSLLGAVVYYFMLPETEGRSLEDVQAHFRGELDLTDENYCRRRRREAQPGETNDAYSPDV